MSGCTLATSREKIPMLRRKSFPLQAYVATCKSGTLAAKAASYNRKVQKPVEQDRISKSVIDYSPMNG